MQKCAYAQVVDINFPVLARLAAMLRSGERKLTMTEQQPVCKWNYQTKGRIGRFSPAIARNGTVYVGDRECLLYAISNDGKLVWRRRTPGRPSGSAALITYDNAILIRSETGRLSAFNAAGDVLWSSNPNWFAVTSPVAARDGAVIFGGRRHDKSSGQPDRLMALDRWGAELARVADLSRRMSHTRREARKIPLDTPRFPQP